MTKSPNYDVKIKPVLAALKPGERTCALTGETWFMDEEEIAWYRKVKVLPPKYSPRTRLLMLHYFGTGYQWWWNKHFDTGEPVLSFHHPASGVRVLPEHEWFDRDFSNITHVYDPTKSFFGQLFDFIKHVPMGATCNSVPPENSIALVSLGDKNSYFVTGSRTKNSFYSVACADAEDVSEVWSGIHITSSWRVSHAQRLHKCFVARDCLDCIEGAFLFDCRNCEYCFGATNRRNRKFIWFNEQLSEEEWKKRRGQVDLGSRKEFKKWMAEFERLLRVDTVWPENFNDKANNSTGEYLLNTTNCKMCYDSTGAAVNNYWCHISRGQDQNNAYCIGLKDSSDNFLCQTPFGCSNCRNCWRCFRCDSCKYCFNCLDCVDCFGCVGLRNKKYCIFNKQFEPEEYFKRLDEIKCALFDEGVYGDPWPLCMSTNYAPYSWTATLGLIMQKQLASWGAPQWAACADDACGLGGESGDGMTKVAEIPDGIDSLDDSWAGKPLWDDAFGRKFSILKPELDFYRAHRLPPPNSHFIKRLIDTVRSCQLPDFDQATCKKCGISVLTSFNAIYPDRVIYCRACYLKYLEAHG